MYNLLIDIGNSDIKAALNLPGSYDIKLIKRYSYQKKSFRKDFNSGLESIFRFIDYTQLIKIGISVLNNEYKDFTGKYIYRQTGIDPVFVDRNIRLPIKIKYGEGIGNDRICNAVAAKEIFGKKNMLIIDFGTATTYTMVSGNVLTGGLIAPGIKTSMLSLTEKTSLPEIELVFPEKIINNNTIDNIKSGVMHQTYYSVIGIIKELRRKNKFLYTIATGGLSELFDFDKSVINITDKYLALKGIGIILSK
ncbi:MAG: type III pantothenate kinase [Ignavibacteria bacterium]